MTPELLLIAQSAGMLARSAARAKLCCATLDHFADSDTRRHACASLALDSPDEAAWRAAADRLAPPGAGVALVYGSGIDTCPGLVEKLAQGRRLLGNSPETLRRVNDPRRFFRLLAEWDIPHPETRFSAPERGAGWLIKHCGEGGKGVAFAAKKCLAGREAYFQRFIEGEALSALFLANGRDTQIIGFNTQSTANHDPALPFLFAGAVNRADLSDAQRSAVAEYVARLAQALGLVGLNSLDFVRDGGVCRVLEINPRPSATMALYDADFGCGLLQAHIAACGGELPPLPRPGPARALRIVYAPLPLTVPEDFAWPEGCCDIPNPGTAIVAGQPVCSLIATGKDAGAASASSRDVERAILRGLMGRFI